MVHRATVLVGLCLTLPSIFMAGATGVAEDEGQKEWFLATDEKFDVVAASVRVEASTPTTCMFKGKLAGESTIARSELIMFERPNEPPWMFYATTSRFPIHANVGDVINTQSQTLEGMWASWGWTTWTFTGSVDITLVGHDLAPWPNNETHVNSMEITIDCDHPVTTKIAGDQDAKFVTTHHSSAGVAVWADTIGGYILGSIVTGDYLAEDVRFKAYASGDQLATINLDHPEGQEDWVVDPQTDWIFISHEGGKGPYEMRVNRVNLKPHTFFWSFLAGFHEVDHLGEIKDLPTLSE